MTQDELVEHNIITVDRILELISHEGGDRDTAQRWVERIERCTSRAKAEKLLEDFSEAWNFCGVEFIKTLGDDDYCNPEGLLYCNAGDAYAATLLYDTAEGEFSVGCYGDWVEKMQQEVLEEAWNNWIASAFEKAIEKHLDLFSIEVGRDTLRDLFNEACQVAGSWPEAMGDGYGVETSKIAKVVSIEMLERHEIEFETMDWQRE